MSYEIKQLAPNLVRIEMSGHMDKDTAKVYYDEACQLLYGSPKPTNLIMDARDVKSVCPVARDIVDKVRFHPHVGTIVFLVRQRYLVLFSPVVQFFSGLRMFGSDEEAMAFLGQRSYIASPVCVNGDSDDSVSVDGTSVPVENVTSRVPQYTPVPAPKFEFNPFGGSKGSNPITGTVTFFTTMVENVSRPFSSPRVDPVTGVVTFFADMVEGMTRSPDDLSKTPK